MIRFRKAVLIIHGFAGGTYDEENLAFSLELEKNLDVYTFTLPGHDKSIMTGVKKDDWTKACCEKIELLIKSGYKNIYVIGHSMGGVLASYLASKYKQIKKLVLAAPAFEAMDSSDGNINIFSSLKKTPQIVKTYSTDEIISRVIKMPLPMVFEFQKLIQENQELPKKITCPTLIIHGTNDQIVPLSSSKKIYENLKVPYKKMIIANDITHHLFKSDKTDILIKEVISFLKYNNHLKEEIKEV